MHDGDLARRAAEAVERYVTPRARRLAEADVRALIGGAGQVVAGIGRVGLVGHGPIVAQGHQQDVALQCALAYARDWR